MTIIILSTSKVKGRKRLPSYNLHLWLQPVVIIVGLAPFLAGFCINTTTVKQ